LESGELRALSLSGKVRQILAVPGRLRLEDIAADGRLLVQQGVYRYGMIAGKGQSQHDLSWLDFAFLRAISEDGKTILFEEEGSQEKNYTVFVRDVDNSPAIPLGEGYAVALSRDKRWVLAQKLAAPGDLWLLPVGTGESRRISPPKLTPINAAGFAGFLPDGRHVVYVASEAGHGLRTWLQDLEGGEPRAITEEGVYGARVSPDAKWLLAGRNARPELLVPMQGGTAEAVRGVKPQEEILGWTSDGQLYGMSASKTELKAHVDKLNPHTGARSAWGDLSMPPFVGVFPQSPYITPDGSAYAFGYRLELWDIYTVSGAR
jgi:hypothetical protein